MTRGHWEALEKAIYIETEEMLRRENK